MRTFQLGKGNIIDSDKTGPRNYDLTQAARKLEANSWTSLSLINSTISYGDSKMSKRDGGKIYSVTLINKEKGLNATIKVRSNEYILDVTEEQGVQLPSACRAGACVVCNGKILKGSVDQSDHSFLKEKELAAGFVLTCRACPTSDCTILTHQEDALFGF